MENLGILTVEGVDAATFLQGYLTADLDEIETRIGSPTALTDIKGRVLANGWYYGSQERVSLVVHSSLLDSIAQHLGRYMVFSKSSLEKDFNDWDVSADSTAQDIVLNPMAWRLIPREPKDVNWPRLTVESKFPLVTARTSGSFLPQMLSLTEHGAVSFTKGCYLGQEIVARAEHRGAVKRRLSEYSVSDGTVHVGAKLFDGKRNVGVVVAVYLDRVLAVTSGNVESIRSEDGTELTPLLNGG